MARQVIKTQVLQRDLTSGKDNFKDRLVKMIPGEVVAAYLACNTTITQFKGEDFLYWVVLGFMLLLMPFYLVRIMKVTDTAQIVIMCVAFLLWCATIQKPFDLLFDGNVEQQQLYSTLALTLFTFTVPVFYKGT
jgi:hypothetical protein